MVLTLPMAVLGQLEYDDAVAWLAQLRSVMVRGTQLVVTGVDRDWAKASPAGRAARAEASASTRWLASPKVISTLLEAAGWEWVTVLEPEEPWAFRVSATR